VELDRARDVAFVVEIRVLVDLGHDDAVVAQVLREPLGGHEHPLRVIVVRHPWQS
jgi:hypothetical protein